MKRIWIAAAMLIGVATGAFAQEAITLEAAIARALERSGHLAELQAQKSGAEAAEAGIAATRQPLVSVSAGYTRTNHVEEFRILQPGAGIQILYPDVPDNYRSRFDLQWPIYTARTDALQRAARSETSAVGYDLEAARADLRLEVARAFWAAVTAREAERVLARAVQRMDAHVTELRVRLDQGLIPPNDVTSAQAQRSQEHLLAIEARNNRQVADAALQRLIGSAVPVTPVEVLTASGQKTEIDPGWASPSSRPEHKALDQRLEAARVRERDLQGIEKPLIAAAAGYDYARPNPRIFPRADQWNDSWDVGVNVSWTLWDGGRRRAAHAEAAAAARATEARRVELERELDLELRQRQYELDSSRAAITAAEDGVRSALETQRVVGERYRAGVATNTDVLDAEIALLQAELERTRALATARLALARLERATGR